MPLMERDDKKGPTTRSQAGVSTSGHGSAEQGAPTEASQGTSSVSTQSDLAAIMSALKLMSERQEEQARCLQEQLIEQVRRQEEQAKLIVKDVATAVEQQLGMVREQILEHDERITKLNVKVDDVVVKIDDVVGKIDQVEKEITNTKIKAVAGIPTISTSVEKFKVPQFDGRSSWAAYRLQFEKVVEVNGWDKEQAATALILGLRDQALSVLEAVGQGATYDRLLDALETRYGDKHLEHAFRAQLKDRKQRHGENLQQWAIEAEKLVRKAYQSRADVDSMLVEAFINGIRDGVVRAAVRLGHHTLLKEALAHALEVEAVRQDLSAHRLRQVAVPPRTSAARPYGLRCFECGERGHFRARCPKLIRPVNAEREEASAARTVDASVNEEQPEN